MASFESAIAFVLKNEGGLNEDENDRGGITNHGISLNFLRSFGAKYDFNRNGVLEDDIRALTVEQAKLIYKNEFWRPIYERIISQPLCNYVFDMCINHGTGQAIKLLQRATWAATKKYNYLLDDGVFGEKTLAAINDISYLVQPLLAERAGFMRLLAEKYPDQRRFLDGWLKRCYLFG